MDISITGERMGQPMSVEEMPLKCNQPRPELDLHGFWLEEACDLLIHVIKVLESRGYKQFEEDIVKIAENIQRNFSYLFCFIPYVPNAYKKCKNATVLNIATRSRI